MTEHRLFSGPVPEVSTYEYHRDRPRAPHLEEAFHRGRLYKALEFVTEAVTEGASTVSDLGCGDGGLLSLIQEIPGVRAWGYDFHPASQAGWYERGVTAYVRDLFHPGSPVNEGLSDPVFGDVTVMTEVLEHLADPHGALRWAREGSGRLVCSSPWNERPGMHSDCHAWAWDLDGYARMIQEAGWTIDRHEQVDLFQVVLAH